MTFGDTLQITKESIQYALDDLISPRSSRHYQSKALEKLEYLLASACCASSIRDSSEDDKDGFFALQYTFECNVPSKLLSWITLATLRLESITNRGLMEDGRRPEAEELATQLALALSLIQGVALNHESSKFYLGRKCSLEILLDLLLASRHLSLPAESTSKSKTASPLTSVILDTLLCILVDSCAAIRSFEEASGTQAVVKILKRAGTPREVRMKCLEFLYFYLLDETPTSMQALETVESTSSPAAPATPIRPSKPYLSATPMRPSSRYGSSTYSFSTSTSSSYYTSSTSSLSGSGSSSSSSSSRSTSDSSAHSFSSTSSNASSSTTVSSILSPPDSEPGSALSPAKTFSKSPGNRITTPSQQQPCTPPNSLLTTVGVAKFPQVRSMMMLKKEVDYTPQSPKKVAGLGARYPHGHSRNLSSSTSFHSRSKSRLISTESLHEEMDQLLDISSPLKQDLERTTAVASGRNKQEKWRTTEEKKELLGTMLGNVDALVEGVRKAGIWGLG